MRASDWLKMWHNKYYMAAQRPSPVQWKCVTYLIQSTLMGAIFCLFAWPLLSSVKSSMVKGIFYHKKLFHSNSRRNRAYLWRSSISENYVDQSWVSWLIVYLSTRTGQSAGHENWDEAQPLKVLSFSILHETWYSVQSILIPQNGQNG